MLPVLVKITQFLYIVFCDQKKYKTPQRFEIVVLTKWDNEIGLFPTVVLYSNANFFIYVSNINSICKRNYLIEVIDIDISEIARESFNWKEMEAIGKKERKKEANNGEKLRISYKVAYLPAILWELQLLRQELKRDAMLTERSNERESKREKDYIRENVSKRLNNRKKKPSNERESERKRKRYTKWEKERGRKIQWERKWNRKGQSDLIREKEKSSVRKIQSEKKAGRKRWRDPMTEKVK